MITSIINSDNIKSATFSKNNMVTRGGIQNGYAYV